MEEILNNKTGNWPSTHISSYHVQTGILIIVSSPPTFYVQFQTLEAHSLTCAVKRKCGPMSARRFAALPALRSATGTTVGTTACFAAWLASSYTHTHIYTVHTKGNCNKFNSEYDWNEEIRIFHLSSITWVKFWMMRCHNEFSFNKSKNVKKYPISQKKWCTCPASVSLELTWSEARPKRCWSFPCWSGQCALIITERVRSLMSTREWWSPSVTSHGNTACAALTHLQPHINIQLQMLIIKLFLWWVTMQYFLFIMNISLVLTWLYSNPLVFKQLVYEFSLIWDAQINTGFSIYEPIFAYMSYFLSQTDRYSRREVMGN
jgi:hypothetical protein